MPPGLLFVASRLSSPTTLTPAKFCDWYENIHIQEVTALPGVPSAIRFESVEAPISGSNAKQNANGNGDGDGKEKYMEWLTLYEMPDIEYRNTAEFKGLDGQSPPKEELLEGIFKQARFDTRFYALVDTYTNPSLSSANTNPALDSKTVRKMIVCTASRQPSPTTSSSFDQWYKEEHYNELAKCKGYVRTRRFELVYGTVLEGFERKTPKVGVEGGTPRFLAVHEFVDGDGDGKGDGVDWEGVGRTGDTEWAKQVKEGLLESEVGWWRGKRGYGGKE